MRCKKCLHVSVFGQFFSSFFLIYRFVSLFCRDLVSYSVCSWFQFIPYVPLYSCFPYVSVSVLVSSVLSCSLMCVVSLVCVYLLMFSLCFYFPQVQPWVWLLLFSVVICPSVSSSLICSLLCSLMSYSHPYLSVSHFPCLVLLFSSVKFTILSHSVMCFLFPLSVMSVFFFVYIKFVWLSLCLSFLYYFNSPSYCVHCFQFNYHCLAPAVSVS